MIAAHRGFGPTALTRYADTIIAADFRVRGVEVRWTYALLNNRKAEAVPTQSVIDHAVRATGKKWDQLGPLLRRLWQCCQRDR